MPGRHKVVLLVMPWSEFDAARERRDPEYQALMPVDTPPSVTDADNLRTAAGEDGDTRYDHVCALAADPHKRGELIAWIRETIPQTVASARLSTCKPPYSSGRCKTVT